LQAPGAINMGNCRQVGLLVLSHWNDIEHLTRRKVLGGIGEFEVLLCLFGQN
jgi:hypothetical protein